MDTPQALRETLDYLIGRVGILEGRLAQASAPRVSRPVRTVTDAEVEAVKAGLAYLGTDLPPDADIRRWLTRNDVAGVLAGVDAYLAPYKDIATHPSSGLQPGQDWRTVAAGFAVHKSHDLWQSVFSLTGEPTEDVPYVPAADELPNLFADAGTPLSVPEMERFVPEVIARAEDGYTWAGNHVTAATLAATKARADAPRDPDDEWADERLRRVLILTDSPITHATRALSLERWLWLQWRTSRPNPGSAYWDGAR